MSRKQRKRREQLDRKQARKRKERQGTDVELAEPPYKVHQVPLERISDTCWRVPRRGPMHVEGRVFADESLLPDLRSDRCLEQVANVATLPGITGPSLAMPDIHWGYGFPIGGVAAFDPDAGGVVSPGGVGYDINCGVRFLTSDVSEGDLKSRLPELTNALFEAIPAGVGSRRKELTLDRRELQGVLSDGLNWAQEKGYATANDVACVEERGRIEGADPSLVSDRARQRGLPQLGTLGSGNHFAEIGVVDEVFCEATAEAYGLRLGQVTLMIHSGSRGLGHQVCTDSLQTMLRAAKRYGIPLVDRQLCCAPIGSEEADHYLAAMAAAANYAFVNRQVMTHWARDVFRRLLKAELRTLYDVCHNIAKFEDHVVPGAPEGSEAKRLLVHRKGATRALPALHPNVPEPYQTVGQPVIIPGDMGRYSFVLRGAPGSRASLGSACHGAGRLLSRSEAKRRFSASEVQRDLERKGIYVRGASRETIVEEVPAAYKDVADVVGVVDAGGLAARVARIRPVGCVKG